MEEIDLPYEAKIYRELVGMRKDMKERDDANGWKDAAEAWREVAELFKKDNVGEALKYLEKVCDWVFFKRWLPAQGGEWALFAKVSIAGIEFVGRGKDLGGCILDVKEQVLERHKKAMVENKQKVISDESN